MTGEKPDLTKRQGSRSKLGHVELSHISLHHTAQHKGAVCDVLSNGKRLLPDWAKPSQIVRHCAEPYRVRHFALYQAK